MKAYLFGASTCAGSHSYAFRQPNACASVVFRYHVPVRKPFDRLAGSVSKSEGVRGMTRRNTARFCIAALAATVMAAAVPVGAQQRHSTQWRTKKDDSRKYAKEDAAREFGAYARCVVSRRYGSARAMVLAGLGSPEQAKAAGKVVKAGDDPCLKAGMDELRMKLKPEVLAGGLAQALVLKDYPDLPSVVDGYTIDPADEAARSAKLNAVELFGRCVVQRDPAGAFALFSAPAATPAERQAIVRLRDDLAPCLAAGSTIKINEMFLRNSLGVAAYRLAQQISPRGGTETASR